MIEHSHPSRVLLDNINTIQNQVSRVTATMQFLNFQMRNANGRSIKDTIFFLLYFAFPSTLFHLQCGGKLFFSVSFYFYIVVIGSQFCILCANEITKLTYNVLRDTCCWAMAIAQDIHFNTYFSNSKLLYYNLFFSCSRAVFVNICLFCLVFYCHSILFCFCCCWSRSVLCASNGYRLRDSHFFGVAGFCFLPETRDKTNGTKTMKRTTDKKLCCNGKCSLVIVGMVIAKHTHTHST